MSQNGQFSTRLWLIAIHVKFMLKNGQLSTRLLSIAIHVKFMLKNVKYQHVYDQLQFMSNLC